MKFGFIAHPTSLGLKRHVKMVDLIERYSKDQEYGFTDQNWKTRNLVPFVDFGHIVSANSSSCEGVLYYMPLTAEEMLKHPRYIAERVVEGVNELKILGAELVGLGGFTGIVGNRGINTLEKAGIPVTTGNSLTAYAAYQNILDSLKYLEQKPYDTEIALVGYPGSIVLVLAKLLLLEGCKLVLVHRGNEGGKKRNLEYIPCEFHNQIRLTNDITTCYDKVRFYVAATSSGSVIDPYRLAPGSVVIDTALPRDVMTYHRDRKDILIIDGGLVSAEDSFFLGNRIMEIAPDKMMNGCMAETMLLALEGRPEPFSIGRELNEKKVLEIGEVAKKHGFNATRLASYGERIEQDHFYSLKRFLRTPKNQRFYDLENWPTDDIHSEVFQLFGEHINPYYRDFYKMNFIDRVFVNGKGSTLVTHDGKRFLDFVAGFGCLNTGHNHPYIVEAIKKYLDKEYPTFIQYTSAPLQTSFLAKRLVELSPGNLERVFFSNSGTEAVEAAIKLARAAMQKPRFLYTYNGYHGKTLGALSVTGRNKHRRAFEPLLSQFTCIPYADIDALKYELEKGDVGAFILEPIQGEGGVIIPPEGYLSRVQELCGKYDCIFIVDEIQTGFGRTGKMFACEWENIEPDILILSKSLSGGLVPIGATLSKKEIWDRAYGSADNFALHSSTFGGGNLAATAGIATIEVIEKEKLVENANNVGTILKAELQRIAKNYPFIKEVRGCGLMIAIEFSNPYMGGINGIVREYAGRIPGNLFMNYRFISDKAKKSIDEAIKEVENSFEDMFILRIVTKLSQQYNILTFITANSNKIMRIQPPLVLSEQQARYFVECFEKVCQDMATSFI